MHRDVCLGQWKGLEMCVQRCRARAMERARNVCTDTYVWLGQWKGLEMCVQRCRARAMERARNVCTEM